MIMIKRIRAGLDNESLSLIIFLYLQVKFQLKYQFIIIKILLFINYINSTHYLNLYLKNCLFY